MEKRVYFKKYRRADFTSGILIFMLLFGSFFTLVSPVGADPIATIRAENITLEPNSYAVVGVYADVPSPGLAGYDLDINYDPSKIQIVGITRSASFAPPTPEFGVNDLNPSSIPGKLTVVYASSRGTQGTFKLFNVQVKALETLTDVSPFTITVKDFVGPDLADLTPNLQVTWIPDEPNVSADNQNNLIDGLAVGMEYSIDNSEFTPFISGNLPNLSGNHTVFVRIAGTDTSPPGAERMLRFSTLEQVAMPQAVVGSTTYHSGNMDYIALGEAIHLTSATPGVTFYYTLGAPGSEPGNPSLGTAYVDSTGISIPDGKTIIKVIAVKDGMDDSYIANFTFINKVSMPYVMVGGIQYNYKGTPTSLSVPQGVSVFLGSSTGSDVSFYYTTDESTPTIGSTSYNPLTGITDLPLGTTTLKVLGTKNSLADSGISTFLVVTVTQPLVSTAPLESQLSVLNNPSGTDDTVTVQDLHGGDIVKVYADATTQIVLGTGTLPLDQTTGSEMVIIPQLGTSAGTIYVSVTSPGMSESSRTMIGYLAEGQTDDTTLSDITLTAGVLNPTFDKNVTVYNVIVPIGSTEVPQITAVPSNPRASVLITQAPSMNGTAQIVVTAEDQVATRTYEIHFTLSESDGIEKYVLGDLLTNSVQFNDILGRFGLDHLRVVIPPMYFQDIVINYDSMVSEMTVQTLSQVYYVKMFASDETEFNGTYYLGDVYKIGFSLGQGSQVTLKAYDNNWNELDSLSLIIKNFHYTAPTVDKPSYVLQDLISDTTKQKLNEILGKFSLNKLKIYGEMHIFSVNRVANNIFVHGSNQVTEITVTPVTMTGINPFDLTIQANGLFSGNVQGLSGDVRIDARDSGGTIIDTKYYKL